MMKRSGKSDTNPHDPIMMVTSLTNRRATMYIFFVSVLIITTLSMLSNLINTSSTTTDTSGRNTATAAAAASSSTTSWFSTTQQQQQIHEKNDEDIDAIASHSIPFTALSSIEYVSGRIGYNEQYDSMMGGRMFDMKNYRHNFISDQQLINKECSGIIKHVMMSCCYVYEHYFPAFMLDDVARWKNHIRSLGIIDEAKEFFNISSLRQIPEGGWNNYRYEDKYPGSFYFCMHPREHELNVSWTSIRDIIPNNVVPKTTVTKKIGMQHKQQLKQQVEKDTEKDKDEEIVGRKLIIATGKWGYNRTFQQEVTEACNLLNRIGIFDAVYCYDDEPDFLLNDTRFERHMRYQINPNDDSRRGGGYWFHKAVIIRYLMDYYNDQDYIIWIDVDQMDRFEQLKFRTVIETVYHRDADLVIDIPRFWDLNFTKEDVFMAFNATETIRNSRQNGGAFQVIVNSPKMRKYYDAIIKCNCDYHMISDERSYIPNPSSFVDHRHDQSILSLFNKKYLTNQTIIGPPALNFYYMPGHLHTYNLDESLDVQCPFESFYERYNITTP